MSYPLEQQIKCPCGEEFEGILWGAVNVQEEPALHEEILAGQLNVVKCPQCQQLIYAERFLLYHDPKAELMVFVYPKRDASEREKWMGKTQQDFRTAQGALEAGDGLTYRPCTVFGLDELVDLLRREQEEIDEGDILASLAGSLSLDIFTLRPSVARERGMPSRLPFGKIPSASGADRLNEGLRLLLKANHRLAVYGKLMERLSKGELDLSGVFEKGKNSGY